MYNDIILYGPYLTATLPLNTDAYPLQKFDWVYPMRGDEVNKPQTAGRYDTRVNADAMLITCEGEILGDTVADYIAKRKALLNLVIPKRIQANYRHSRLLITLIDDPTTPYYADVQLKDMSCPQTVETGSPTVSPFQFNWECNAGFWTNFVSGHTEYI